MKTTSRITLTAFFSSFLLLFACEEPQAPDLQEMMQDPDTRNQIMNTISQDAELSVEMMAEMLEAGPMTLRDSAMISYMNQEEFTHEMMQGYPGIMHNMMAHMMSSVAKDSTSYKKVQQMMKKDNDFKAMMENWCDDIQNMNDRSEMPPHQ